MTDTPDREKANDAARQAWLESASDYTKLDECIAASCAAYEAELSRQGFVVVPKGHEHNIKEAFVRSCVDFRAADVAGDSVTALRFYEAANAIEDAYPDLFSAQEGNNGG